MTTQGRLIVSDIAFDVDYTLYLSQSAVEMVTPQSPVSALLIQYLSLAESYWLIIEGGWRIQVQPTSKALLPDGQCRIVATLLSGTWTPPQWLA